MKRSITTAIFASMLVSICAAAQAQNPPANSSTSAPPTSAPSSNDSSASPSASPAHKDTSRAAKEQQSQKQKCPKNGDTSNVNCKERGQSPK